MTTTENPFTKRYPDTAKGAAACHLDLSTATLPDGEWRPDPHVYGCWGFFPERGSDPVAIVWLAGYEDPWGRTRERNDFDEDIDL